MNRKYSNNKSLVKQLKKGNEKAYNSLVKTYYNELCIYVTNLSQDRFKSEDIVQNVIIRIWEQREKLNPDFSIKSLLYKSVYNEFIDQYRRDIAVTALEKKYIEGLNTFYEKKEGENELERLITVVKNEIELLPPRCKETFLLSKQEGLTYVEIAGHLKVSIKTVESQMNRAFSIIRKKVDRKISRV